MATRICAECGSTSNGKTVTPGSILIEIILWIAFIVPGLIYSIWRHTVRRQVCPSCGAAALIDPMSPRGLVLMRQYHNMVPSHG